MFGAGSADSLMRDAKGVAEGDVSGLKQVERATLAHSKHYQRFMVKDKQFDRQFSHIYSKRTQEMGSTVRDAARKRWGAAGIAFKERIIELALGEEAALVGTLYKDMPKKPCVLDEYADEAEGGDDAAAGGGDGAEAKRAARVATFSSEKDSLVLEDGSGRVPLVFDGCEGGCPVGELVTGVVIAVEGTYVAEGEAFCVKRWCSAGMPAQEARAPEPATEGCVLLVSGLALGSSASAANALPTQLLVDHVTGHLGGEGEQAGAARIARVVVAGSSVELPAIDSSSLAGKRSKAQQDAMAEPLRQADLALAQLAATAPVDVMPGASDPANHALPQQPMHRCLFPGATQYATFHCVTNPHEASVGGARILGHAGQPLDDVVRSSAAGTAPIDVLERTLGWSHMAPTAPDTLSCYPFHESDPFVLKECPHVYFAANQDAFATKLVEGAEGQKVRLICVPSFATTCTAVLLNIATLECEPITFAVDGMGAAEDADMGEAPPPTE